MFASGRAHALRLWSCALALAACSDRSTSFETPPITQRDSGADAALHSMVEHSPRGTVTAEPNDDAAYLYDQTQLRTFELELSPADLEQLDRDPVAETYVPGTLRFEGQAPSAVGIRYKGSVGSFIGCTSVPGLQPSGMKTCAKLSIKVSFDYHDPEARFYGLKKLLFHSMNSDASLMRDRLGYALFREMGVPAPRSVHARLVVNGKLLGLFALVEEVDGRFTRSRFGDGGEGNLYKEVWPIHASEKVYLDALQTNRDEATRAVKILDFASGLAAADEAALPALIDTHMDREVTLRYVAVDRTIRSDDGAFHWYCGVPAGQGNNPGPWGNHNYYFYEETSSNQLWLIPWDLDLSFRGEKWITPIVAEWNDQGESCACQAGVFGAGQRAPACDPLIRGWGMMDDDYHTQVRALLAGPFSDAAVTGKLNAWADQIRPAVIEVEGEPGQLSANDWHAALRDLRNEVNALRRAAAARLAPE